MPNSSIDKNSRSSRRKRRRGSDEKLMESNSGRGVRISLWQENHTSTGEVSLEEKPPHKLPVGMQMATGSFTEEITNATGGSTASESARLLQQLWNAFARSGSDNTATPPRQPTPIQQHVWNVLLCRDSEAGDESKSFCSVVALSPTGSGKTLAYGLPLLVQAQLHNSKKEYPSHSMILVPTRELAKQVQEALQTISSISSSSPSDNSLQQLQPRPYYVEAFYGGVDRGKQWNQLTKAYRKKASIVIAATPGRIFDLISTNASESNGGGGDHVGSGKVTNTTTVSQKAIIRWWMDHVHTVVLDEADRLVLQMDLRTTSEQILTHCSPIRLILCSATKTDNASVIWNQWLEKYAFPNPVVLVQTDTIGMAASLCPNNEVIQRGKCDTANITGDSWSNDLHVPTDAEAVDEVEASTTSFSQIMSQPSTNASLSTSSFCRIPPHVKQIVHVCAQHKKPKKLWKTLQQLYHPSSTDDTGQYDGEARNQRGIVFFAKIATLKYIASFLRKQQQIAPPKHPHVGNIVELHSQLPQPVREKAMESFRRGECQLLLATDLCARGIHVEGVQFVINYDFPGNLEQYVHRCGRAGRGDCVAPSPIKRATISERGVVVYSFLTREMAPLCPDLVQILQSTNQWIDPNLQALVTSQLSERRGKRDRQGKSSEEYDDTSERLLVTTKNQSGRGVDRNQVTLNADTTMKTNEHKSNSQIGSADDELPLVDDAFPGIGAHRIVLKRATHVSDASSSSTGTSDNDDDEKD